MTPEEHQRAIQANVNALWATINASLDAGCRVFISDVDVKWNDVSIVKEFEVVK